MNEHGRRVAPRYPPPPACLDGTVADPASDLDCRPVPDVQIAGGASAHDIAIFHYLTKSKEDFEAKMERGGGGNTHRKWSHFQIAQRCAPASGAACARATFAFGSVGKRMRLGMRESLRWLLSQQTLDMPRCLASSQGPQPVLSQVMATKMHCYSSTMNVQRPFAGCRREAASATRPPRPRRAAAIRAAIAWRHRQRRSLWEAPTAALSTLTALRSTATRAMTARTIANTRNDNIRRLA